MSRRNLNQGIIPWFAHNPVAANLLMILVIALGVFQLPNLQKEAFPPREPDSLTVSVGYNSGSARQNEEGIAIKIEEALEDVIGIKQITSTASTSNASVQVTKQNNYDLDQLLDDVRAKVDSIDGFPSDADKPVIEKSVREEHALWIQLYGDANRATLQTLAEEMRRDLVAKADISRATVTGNLSPMLIVEVDEGRLQALGISLSDVEEAINAGSSAPMSATLRNDAIYLPLEASRQAYQAIEFADLPLITLSDGRKLKLGEVAKVSDQYDDTTSALSRYNGEPSIAVQLIATGNDDITNAVAAAKAVVATWQARTDLPAGIKIVTWNDRSESISDRLDLLIKNAATGVVLVFLLLAIFLNLTVAFWVAAGLPFTFFGTLYLMGDNYLGLTLNEFTTFGFIMALGIVVDDAVVVGESVYTERKKHGDTLNNTIAGTLKVAVPTLFGVFTTVAAFYSLSQIEGGLGQIYAQFAAVVTLCLLLSVVESKIILPAHLAHLNTRVRLVQRPNILQLPSWLWGKIQLGADSGLAWVTERLYRPLINHSLKHRYAVLILFIAMLVFVITMPFTGLVRMSFFPDIPGDSVRAELTMQSDIPFGMTHQTMTTLEQFAYQADHQLLDQYHSDHTTGIAHLQVMSTADQTGQVSVELSDDAPYSIDEFTRQWRNLSGQPEGVKTLLIQNARRPVSALRMEVRADNDALLAGAGAALKAMLESIPPVSGIEDNLSPSQPVLRIKVNPLGEAMGLTSASLASQVLKSFSGQEVQSFRRDADEIEVRVRYPDEDRRNPGDILRARVRTDDGTVVPLSQIAEVERGFARDSITRIDGKRAVYISADVDKTQLSATELVSLIQTQYLPDVMARFPGIDVHFGGEAEEQAETQSSMIQMFAIALLVIYMLLAVPLKSYLQPVLIMSAIPFGVVGAILGHWVNDLSLGILSLNGMIAMAGVVVNDSLLLTSTFNQLKGKSESIKSAITEACCGRLRAVLLTSVTTFAGLVPLLGETSHQAQFLIPAAVSLGYGIMFATLITLILIPVQLAILEDAKSLIAQLTPNRDTTDA